MPQNQTISSGELNRRITIQRLVPTRHPTGEMIDSWVDVIKPWANWKPMQGTEEFRQDRRAARQTGVFRIRFAQGIDPKMRVLWNNVEYDIERVEEVNFREGLDLFVVARDVPSGGRP